MQDHKTKAAPVKACNSENKGKDQEVFHIPVVINGNISSNKRNEVLIGDSLVLNNGDSVNSSLKIGEYKCDVDNVDASVLNLFVLNKGHSVNGPLKIDENKSDMNNLDASVLNLSKGKHNILIIGDSHLRHCARKVKDNLNTSYNVTRMVKPGSDINILTNSVRDSVQVLSKNDVLIFSGGTRDVGSNETTEGLRQIQNFVRENDQTNIVLLCVPYRHDLESWSCVNNEVTVFNRKLTKSMKCYEHVTVISHNFKHELYTRHGLHLNNLGKDHLSKRIASICSMILNKEIRPIHLPWKEKYKYT
jgi:hypothetical protein